MITKLTLKNFRCFRDFTLDGIRPVTLIAGANSAGKSSILESVFLFMDRHSSELFHKLNAFRGIQEIDLSPKMVWEPLFSDMDASKAIEIGVTNDGESREQKLVIRKDDSFSISSVPGMQAFPNIQAPTADSYSLKLAFKSQTKNDASHFLLTTAGITLTQRKPISAKTPVTQYLGAKNYVSPDGVSELYGKLVLRGESAKCIEVLRILDPRIKDLSTITIGGVSGLFADIGLASLLSVNMLGDGINKLMQIALVMLANPESILLIDEIENGFHYSFYPKLWEMIGKLSGETGCQVIATTHSYECISGATALAAGESELFRFIRLDRIEGTVVSKKFENDSFVYAVNNNWEVR